MKEVVLSPSLLSRLKKLYEGMEASYDNVAVPLGFSCDGCPDNCCDSYFRHFTYAEWGYLWFGFQQLSEQQQQSIRKRSEQYVADCREAECKGERPQVMCPLNEQGRCSLYTYRLMVCRTHGVPAVMTRPDGKVMEFPGCFRCQEVVAESTGQDEEGRRMNRTELLRELVRIENDLFQGRRHLYPKIRLTIAEMLVKGPPVVSTPHCER